MQRSNSADSAISQARATIAPRTPELPRHRPTHRQISRPLSTAHSASPRITVAAAPVTNTTPHVKQTVWASISTAISAHVGQAGGVCSAGRTHSNTPRDE